MSITSANALIVLTVPGVLAVATQLQGFAADDVFDTDDVEMAATLMGVDGILSGGFVYSMVPWNIALQADSPSMPVFEAWDQAQQAVVRLDLPPLRVIPSHLLRQASGLPEK